MRPEDLLAWQRRIPFQPYRLILTNGKAYEILHPAMIHVGSTTVYLFFFVGEPVDPFDRMEMVGLCMIDRIEPMEVAAGVERTK